MPSDEMIKLWTSMLTTVPGWIILCSMVVFFAFIGFKIFVGTYAERLLSQVVIENHGQLMRAFENQVRALRSIEIALQSLIKGA